MARRKILVADLLCGAGGSSTGCMQALLEHGWTEKEVELVCVNHWGTAIETHKKNHPLARHYVEDIAAVRPHLIVPEGRLDLLMASPTCTYHSVARGGKPTSDQQRSDPWHIITWCTELSVKRLIIENVWEFIGWGPVDPKTGKPIKSRKGEYFHAWIETLRRLGFEPEWRKLNAADFGDATTRQRFILMARNDRRTVSWPMPTHRKRSDDKLELFPGLQPWKPAREIIDWDIKGKSIFARKKPLAPKTLARIYAGAVKFSWPEPFLVILRNHMAAQSVDGPLPTIAAGGQHIALAEPVFFNGRKNNQAKAISQDPLPTLDTKGGVWLADPVILSQQNSGAPRSASDPLPTITTGGAGTDERPGCARPMLAEPVIIRTNMHGRKSPGARGAEDPLMTITTDGGIAVAEPFIVGAAHGVKASERNPHNRRVKSIDEPIGTIHAGGGNFAIAQPFMLSRQGEGAPRSVSEPTPTQVAKHSHVLISPYYGAGSGETCNSADEPLPTVTTKGRFGIVMPITHSDDSARARDVESDPIPTITTANRGELAFIAAQFGEREGQAPRVHDIEEPTPTLCAEGRVQLVEGVEGEQYDILFRMLEPHELAAAMGFSDEEQAYEFAGNKTEQIKQIGNAVSVKKMKACVSALMADAAPARRAVPKNTKKSEAA